MAQVGGQGGCAFSCLRTWISCCWDRISALMPAGVACQSASEIPAAGVVIAGNLIPEMQPGFKLLSRAQWSQRSR
jgi:hypothetical protein